MENFDDRKLINNYLKGDEKSLEILIRSYLKPVDRFVYGYINNPKDAEDVVQETFVKMWRNLKKFNRGKSFKAWLFSIAKNTSIDFLKKKKTIPFSEFEDIVETFVDPRPMPLELAEQRGIAQTMKMAMANLSDKYRQVLSLHHEQGFAFRQIAESLDESLNTVKSRHRRALIILKKTFKI